MTTFKKQKKQTGATPRPKSNLQTAEAILERTFSTKRLTQKIKRYSLFLDWEAVVGEEIARVTKPKKILRGSTLLVEVADAVWVQELSLQLPTLLKKINASCENTFIDDIRFVAGDPKQF